MKRTRKLLSIVLSLLVAVGSLPIVYTATAASETPYNVIGYALRDTGTIDNPTRPVEASGVIEREDLYKMNINSQSTSYTFYQTMDNEYFTFGQTQGLQQYYDGTDIGNRTLTFESIAFYEGQSGMGGNTEPIEVSTGSGMWEYPLITSNPTTDYLEKYHVSSSWSATNSNAQGLTFPFVLAGGAFDVGGCKVYAFQNDIVFKGNSDAVSGEINTGYYEQLKWNWVTAEASANFDLRIGTTIRVLDARRLVEEMAEAKYIIANADNYTDAYVSSVMATLNSVPDDLRDFSKVYDQSVIDNYVSAFENISLNSADYTEYNTVYAALKGINNSKGAFTDESFAAFKAKIDSINANLPKNLDKTYQSTVDEATQALRDAYNILVATDLSNSNTGANYTTNGDDGDMSFTIDNTVFKFMQTKDSQVFSYDQMWIITRNGGNTDRNFGGMILQTADLSNTCDNSTCRLNQTPSVNNTAAFVSLLTSRSYANITAENEVGTSITAPEFLCWSEYTDASATTPKSTTIIDTSGSYVGALDSNRDYAYSNNTTYYLMNSPEFVGNPAGTYGEISVNYVLRTGWNYKTGGFLGIGATKNHSHIHVNSTIQVTDVRKLIGAVADANETLANPGTHSEAYLTALQSAVDSVPVEMLRGVEYFTQAEVDKLYNDITTIPEEVADYSEFVEVFGMMTSLNADKYTEDSYNTFIDEIYSINRNLAKNLSADNQATVDAAVDALYAAYDKLVSRHLNDDNVFTQDDISDTGYSPLEFSVSSTEYNFMQTVDGQKFAIRTELTVRNSKTRYNCNLLSLRFSNVSADTISSVCDARQTPDTGCHNGENVLVNQSELVLSAVTGVTTYTANDAGDIGEHTTWVNTEGVALSTNGMLNDPTALSTSDSSAYAEMYYVGVSGNQETPAEVDVQYAFRLGWSYYESVLGVAGDTVRRHAHIPVSVKITDARALHSLYLEVEDIMNGDTDKNYTFNSLVNLYNAFKATDSDMANGNAYYTQEEVNAEYAALKAAYDALAEGADYSEFFATYVEAQEIIESGNVDSRGNALYDEATYTKFVDDVTSIYEGLDKDLGATDENQATIDAATDRIREALAALEEGKRADYSALNDAMTEAEKILSAPEGTYTQSTIDALQQAYDNAVALDKTLPASEQAQVDAITSALEAAIADVMYKADYSEFEDAYAQVQDIVNNSDKYTSETVEAARKALADADNLNKDLADIAANRVTIQTETDKLNEVLNNAKEKADYTDYNNAKSEADAIVNDDGNGNPIYNEDAFNEYKEAVENIDTALDKDLSTDEQTTVDEATQALEDLMAELENNKNADYTDFDAAKDALEEIVNAPAGTYTDKTVQKAQDALDNANTIPKDMVVGENNVNQDMIDEATQNMQDAIDSAEKKADYTEFDKAVEELENIVNAPEGTYTDETVKKAQDALDEANKIDTDLPNDEDGVNQGIIDEATQNMQDVINSAEEKADYSDYNNAKNEADNLVNDDGNGNPIYDEDAFNEYKEAVENIDNALDKDLSKDEQSKVDEAVSALENLKTQLEEKKYYTVTFLDADGNAMGTDRFFAGALFGSVNAPALPEDTDAFAYVGWIYENDALVSAEDVLSGDVTVQIAREDKILNLNNEALSIHTSTGYITSEVRDMTVAEFLAMFANDADCLEVKDLAGNVLASDDLVGTGATITLKSKYTENDYEQRTVVVYGDVTGDGLVNADDYAQAKLANIIPGTYTEDNYYFFVANDVTPDGYIDALDSAYINLMVKGYK